MTQRYLNELTHKIIGAAIEVHREPGPGLPESIYEKCLAYLKLLEKPKGILLNFNCTNIFKEGQKTMVTERYAALPKGY